MIEKLGMRSRCHYKGREAVRRWSGAIAQSCALTIPGQQHSPSLARWAGSQLTANEHTMEEVCNSLPSLA